MAGLSYVVKSSPPPDPGTPRRIRHKSKHCLFFPKNQTPLRVSRFGHLWNYRKSKSVSQGTRHSSLVEGTHFEPRNTASYAHEPYRGSHWKLWKQRGHNRNFGGNHDRLLKEMPSDLGPLGQQYSFLTKRLCKSTGAGWSRWSSRGTCSASRV